MNTFIFGTRHEGRGCCCFVKPFIWYLVCWSEILPATWIVNPKSRSRGWWNWRFLMDKKNSQAPISRVWTTVSSTQLSTFFISVTAEDTNRYFAHLRCPGLSIFLLFLPPPTSLLWQSLPSMVLLRRAFCFGQCPTSNKLRWLTAGGDTNYLTIDGVGNSEGETLRSPSPRSTSSSAENPSHRWDDSSDDGEGENDENNAIGGEKKRWSKMKERARQARWRDRNKSRDSRGASCSPHAGSERDGGRNASGTQRIFARGVGGESSEESSSMEEETSSEEEVPTIIW